MSSHTRWTASLAVAALLAGAATVAAAPAAGATAPLDRFKALAGEWVAAEDNEMVKKGELVSRYVVSAGGTAVVETVFPGSPHEMVTVYYVDGSDLALTHYCMEGNQPRMRAKKADGARVDFAFEGGANIDPARTRHMNSAWVEFVGADEIRNQWTEIADGKTVFVAKSHLVRKAR
jgi:hypothetical protein